MRRSLFRAQLTIYLGLLGSFYWCAGCESGASLTGSVSGKVTYNGQPLTVGVVTFVSEETGSGASCELDSSGTYSIRSIRTGEYSVSVHISPPTPEATVEVARARRLNIPGKYQDTQTSGLTATVKGGKNTADFSL